MGDKAPAEPAADTESDVEVVSDSEGEDTNNDKRSDAHIHRTMKRPSSEIELGNGDTVEVHGLVEAAMHNGKHGVLGTYDNNKQRWKVTLENGTVISVKVANLTLVPAAPVLKPTQGAVSLWDKIQAIKAGGGGGGGATSQASTNLALAAVGERSRMVVTTGSGVLNQVARYTYDTSMQHGPALVQGAASSVSAGCYAFGRFVSASLAQAASDSFAAPVQKQIVNSGAAPAGAGGAAAGSGGGFGFGRVQQAADPDPPATPLDQTFAGLFEIAAKDPAMFMPSHKIESCTDGEPTMADPIIQNGGIAWDICQRIPNTDKWGLVVWVATNARKNGTIQGVWVQDAGKPKCPYGPNCAAHANGECDNSHAGCWAHGAPGFDGLPSNGCTCGKQGPLAKVPGHATCHAQNHHFNACTRCTPLGPCAGQKWTPGKDDKSGIIPQYCQAHLVDWVVEQIRNSILEEQDQTQLFPAPIDKEPWGPSNSAYMHFKTKCGDAGQKLVCTAIAKAYGNKKTSLQELKAWNEQIVNEDC